mmetsp:Transcript_5236/g.9152  ORF Transcript_5236/g.9152 Transcript_5236/m.9152 type:complete len:96 (-) Transcript_5236:4525-4812(-)
MEIFTAVSLVQSCSGNLDSCKIFMFSRVRLRLLPLRLGTGIKARKRTGPADSEDVETLKPDRVRFWARRTCTSTMSRTVTRNQLRSVVISKLSAD